MSQPTSQLTPAQRVAHRQALVVLREAKEQYRACLKEDWFLEFSANCTSDEKRSNKIECIENSYMIHARQKAGELLLDVDFPRSRDLASMDFIEAMETAQSYRRGQDLALEALQNCKSCHDEGNE